MVIPLETFRDGNHGWVIKRVGEDATYEQHAHIATLSGCRQLLALIEKNLLPRNEYFQGSCRRLLTETEYAKLKRTKDKYYNSKFRRQM